MQLIQPKVQKWRTTTFPFKSFNVVGLLLIHSSMPWSSGADIFIATGCWAPAQGTTVSDKPKTIAPNLPENIRCMDLSPIEHGCINLIQCCPTKRGHSCSTGQRSGPCQRIERKANRMPAIQLPEGQRTQLHN